MLRLLIPFALAAVAFAQAPESMPDVQGTPQDLATLKYIEISEGTGAPALPGHKFRVHYTGWLTDGTKFDSSLDRDKPFEFVQGARQVIAGWDVGFEGMKVGGERRLLIPYQLGYGEKGNGPIPPKAPLIFDVHLLDVTEIEPLPAAVDILLPLNDLANRTLALARAVPEEKYTFHPSVSPVTFAQILMQMANINKLMLTTAKEEAPRAQMESWVAGKMAAQSAAMTKQQILQSLETSFADVRKEAEKLKAGALGNDAEIFEKPSTRRGIYTLLDAMLGEQLGRATLYAQLAGVPVK